MEFSEWQLSYRWKMWRRVKQPSNSGSHCYDYKGNNSIVLLAVCGPDHHCLWASAGRNGRSPESAIWQNCVLKKAQSSCHNTLNLPKPRPLPGRAIPVPYILTEDNWELKQARWWRQQECHKFAYLTTENNSFAGILHFSTFRRCSVLSATWNDLHDDK